MRTDGKNADPCTSRGCLWNKWTDGKVYIPYYIANHYCEYHLSPEPQSKGGHRSEGVRLCFSLP